MIDDMSYKKLIHDYLDEGVNFDSEENLFSQMAQDTDLRNEFNKQVKINMLAREDMSTITAPAESAGAIFSALGYSLPGSLEEKPKKTPLPISGFLNKYYKFAVVALVSGALTGSGITIYNNLNSNKESNNSSFLQSKSDKGNKSNSVYAHSVPFVASLESSNNDESNQNAENSSIFANSELNNTNRSSISKLNTNHLESADELHFADNDRLILQNNSEFIEDEVQNDINAAFILTSQRENEMFSEKFEKFYSNRFTHSATLINIFPAVQLTNSESSGIVTQYTVALNKLQDNSSPNSNIIGVKSELYDNNSLSAMYNFSSEHSLGLEAAYERWGQEFERNINGEMHTQYQSPARPWIGIVYKYSPDYLNLGSNFKILSQSTAAISSIGPIFRLKLGADYRIYNALSLSIAAEAALLMYNVDGNLYNSRKFGFVYGINYGF